MERLFIAAALVAIIGAYAFGRHDGRSIEVASQAKASRAADDVRIEMQGRVDQLTASAAQKENSRQSSVRKIRHEKETVIEHNPVLYSGICLDTAGVRVLTKAADVANGVSQSSSTGDASASAGTTGKP